MLELYCMPRYPVPYPRNFIKTYDSVDQLQKDLDLSDDEVAKALNGDPVRGSMLVEFSPQWLSDLAVAEIVRDHPEGIRSFTRIAEMLGSKDVEKDRNTIQKSFDRAIDKLQKAGRLRKLLGLVGEIHRVRGDYKDYEVIAETSITISIS